MAAAITDFDGSSDTVEHPEIGELKFYLKKWDRYDPAVGFGFYELETRPCEPSDFNTVEGSNPDSVFYRTNPFTARDLEVYGKKMKCLVNPDFDMYGSYGYDKGAHLMIVFERCDKSKRTCKTDTEIDEWLKFKYIATLENERKFIEYAFKEKRIKE